MFSCRRTNLSRTYPCLVPQRRPRQLLRFTANTFRPCPAKHDPNYLPSPPGYADWIPRCGNARSSWQAHAHGEPHLKDGFSYHPLIRLRQIFVVSEHSLKSQCRFGDVTEMRLSRAIFLLSSSPFGLSYRNQQHRSRACTEALDSALVHDSM